MKYNQGLIYTNENCIGCNRCISGCPILGANVSSMEDGKNRIYVDGNRCIHCGRCLKTCRHNAREYRDDTERFIGDLAKGDAISIVVAPAVYINMAEKTNNLFGYLKSLGVNKIYNVSYGADITTWAYLKYIEENQLEGGISQPCPAVVNYIEKYCKELREKLIPIHSPLMCSAVFIQKYLGNSDKLAFIGPCVAKKDEIDAIETEGMVSYNVTLQHLMERLGDISLQQYYGEEEPLDIGLGTVYSMPGGLATNVERFVERDKMIRQLDGEKRVYPYLCEYSERIKRGKELPFLVDVLNCCQGCNYGTATRTQFELDDDILFELQKKRNRQLDEVGEDPFEECISPKESMKRLNKRFEKLNINDFSRTYHVYEEEYKYPMIEEKYQKVFHSMHKDSKESQEINCHSCGYDTCTMMAEAIFNEYNYKENCVHYVKDENLRMYYTDIATGIPNINAINKFLEDRIQENNAYGYIAINLNIKNFKWINQIFGSTQGDKALLEYAQKIESVLEPDEIAGRIGGDDFIAIIKTSSRSRFAKLLSNVPLNLEGKNREIVLYDATAKAGVYIIKGDEDKPGQILNRAINACSLARKNKSVDIVYYDEAINRKIMNDVSVEQMLKPAMSNHEFVVYYQPKVDIKEKRLIGAEALVRWQHEGELIAPIEFIPICEETGFVVEIDFFVLNSVCEKIRAWMDEGLDVVRVSVNFSKKHFEDINVASKIKAVVEKWNVPSQYVEVEFTETAYIDEYEKLSKTISELREYGLCTAIDDFGTGYSSLNLLKELRFDCLKLDKSFLGKHFTDDRNLAIVTHIIEMAKDLDMEVVAEGIERKEELKFMLDLKCDIAQGYLFDRPLPKEEFSKRLRAKSYK